MAPEGDRQGDREGRPDTARAPLETGTQLGERLDALEAALEDVRRRQVIAELRSDPSRLLAGLADVRRVSRQDLDDLLESLARWDVPLSPAEEEELRRVDLVAQAISGPRRSSILIVVGVAARVSTEVLTRLARVARILSGRSRLTRTVLVVLSQPSLDESDAAVSLGVEIHVDP